MAYPSPDTESRCDIRTLSRSRGVCDMLADLLIETVTLGYTLSGIIPDYALKPHGGLTATMVYWKRIDAR